MRDPLGDTANAWQPVQSAAAESEQIGRAAGVDQTVDRSPIELTNGSAGVASERRRNVRRRRGGRRVVDADDDRRGEVDERPETASDQDRAAGIVHYPRGSAAQEDS